MRIVCESVGGFTGPAGKEVLELNVEALPPARAAQVRRLAARIPTDAWGREFLLAMVRPHDFRHTLRVIGDDGTERSVSFHESVAPAEIRQFLQVVRATEE